ncbi:MAG: hypothetical protein FVQ81_09675 [Candidatus Glassbacteria bacterium]|nr:hypothetical protein [Candidatus Glassbacteria bacterium]
MKFSTFLKVVFFGALLLPPGLASAETIDVTIKGVDDGVRTSKQQDYKEALLHAKLQAIERAGVAIESITRIVNFQMKLKQVETKAKAVLLPGFQVIDIGYTEDGSYQVVLSGKLRVGGATASEDVPAMQMDPVDAPYMIIQKSNIRKVPHGAAERIYVLAAGTEVFVLGISKDRTWAAIEYKGKGLGYVQFSVLQEKRAYLAEQERKRKQKEKARQEANRKKEREERERAESRRNLAELLEAKRRLKAWKNVRLTPSDAQECRSQCESLRERSRQVSDEAWRARSQINRVSRYAQEIGRMDLNNLARELAAKHKAGVAQSARLKQAYENCKVGCDSKTYGSGNKFKCPNQQEMKLIIPGHFFEIQRDGPQTISTWRCPLPPK